MLRQRVITAIALLAVLALALAAPSPWPMLVLLVAMFTVTYWEWLRMTGTPAGRAMPAALLLGAALSWCSLIMHGQPDYALAVFDAAILPISVLFWLLVPWVVAQARLPSACGPMALAAAGAVLIAASWYALAWMFLRHGAAAFVGLWALVWCADIVAYACGRLFGRRRLAPRISPGKTMEGAAAGLLGAVLWLAATAAWWPGSFAALLADRLPWALVLLAGVVLGAWSILGDLFESLLKRRAGIKDSGRLLPGHGGVYDRIDALLPVAVLAMALLIYY